MTETGIYLLCFFLLLLAAFLVFRWVVRRDYLQKGYLTRISSILQLLFFFTLFCFPYLFNPPEWPWFWRLGSAPVPVNKTIGLVMILLGFVIAFGTMFWFGLRRAFGLEVKSLVNSGPYRWTRNPQVIGGYLLVVGTALQLPSLYSLGWVLLYAITTHLMILTEEEHLSKEFPDEYQLYKESVPRYILK